MIKNIKVCLPKTTNPYENLSIEYYLMKTVKPDEIIMSLWQNKKTVVIGRNQNMYKECRTKELISDGGYPARRFSGGGAVFHDLGNLNFSFLVNDSYYDVKRQLSVIINALKKSGINAEMTGRNDVAVDGRKISGNAFLREKQNHCHHGTLLIGVKSEDMVKYLTPDTEKLKSKGVDSVRSRVVNINELVKNITPEIIKNDLIDSFQEVYGLKASFIDENSLLQSEILKVKNLLSSSQWLYGKNPDFTIKSKTHRFSWGSGEIAFKISKEKIAETFFYTDSLDDKISDKISCILSDVPFKKDDIEEQIEKSSLLKDIKKDLKTLIDEVL